MQRSRAQKITGACTVSNFLDSQGEIHKAPATPRRATAISMPIASAIDLPLNHLTIARDTVTPAISVPQPKSMKPRQAQRAVGGRFHPVMLWMELLKLLIAS